MSALNCSIPGWHKPEQLRQTRGQIGQTAFDRYYRQGGSKKAMQPTKRGGGAKSVASTAAVNVADEWTLIHAAKIALAQQNLMDMVEYVMRDNGGNAVTAQPHHRAWVDHLNYSLQIEKVCS